MHPYRADMRDVKFNLLEWLDLDTLLKAEAYKEFDRDQVEMVLDEALKVCKSSVAACNESGDRVGAKWADGKVTLAPGFEKAYRDLADNGWVSVTNNPEYGGMGLPEVVGTGIGEFIMGANTSMSLTALLTRGSAHLIENFGTDDLKARFIEKMYSGAWTGTMCLTEPQAGSDLGDVKTKAVRQEDGTYRISGEKIFITSGDHDLTPNIVHAVLARTPEAPSGAKGLSLFVVPKIRVNADGSLGRPNDVACAGIEHKMGIHGSPTCSLVFGANGECEGYLLGRERLGLLLMFQMMNTARYEVGVQGMAGASAAHQAALAYAKERLQGRDFRNREPKAPQVPTVTHPDMRRSLLTQSAYVQAMRALLSYTAWCMDMAHTHDGAERDRWQGFVELLTPICKAWCSDRGFEVANMAMQCYGGYGYTAEYPAEQYLRDIKIAAIYEGTNGIQSLDLVGRKFKMQGGEPVKLFLADASGTAKELSSHPVLGPSAALLGKAAQVIAETATGLQTREEGQLLTLLNAVPILECFGDVFAGHLLLRQAALAHSKLEALGKSPAESEEAAFYHNKVQAARCYAHRVLPLVSARAIAIAQADVSPMEAIF